MEQSVHGSQCTIDWCPRQGEIGHGGNQNEFPLCAWHERMWGSFLDGWGIGSGKEVRLGRTGNWNELFKLFKQ